MPEVTYVPNDEPFVLVEETVFGRYQVKFEDGFTYMLAHTGYPGTVSEEPVDPDLNPGFREALIQDAIEARGQHEKKGDEAK